MNRIPSGFRKFVIGGSVALIVLLVCFGTFCAYIVTKSFPKVEGTISHAGVAAPVSVFRDAYGVPHLMAESDADAWTSLGYVHAQDRLFQMDLARRAGQGRLSEVFGSRVIAVDAMFRTLGIARTAQRIVDAMPADTREVLEAYSRGVNAYIEQRRSALPVEFDVLNYKPEPWRPVDAMIVLRLMAWELSFAWWTDVATQDVINRVGAKAAMELFPQWPADAPTVMRDEHLPRKDAATTVRDSSRFRTTSEFVPRALREFAAIDLRWRAMVGVPRPGVGSNAWVLGGAHTRRHKPILCNDPHLVITTPSSWYQVHLHSPHQDLAGMTIPGVPFVIIGRNRSVAWGLASAMLDDCDFVVETLDSANPTRYLSHGAFKEMRIRVDTIHVRDTENVAINVYETDHGPIVSAVHPFTTPNLLFDAAVRANSRSIFIGAAVAMHWTGHDVTDECTALLRLNRAHVANDVVDAASGVGAPAQCFLYADTMGSIGFAMGGRVPVRELPFPGVSAPVTSAQDNMIWSSYVPWSQMPRAQNPHSGEVIAANNKISGEFPGYMSDMWEPPSRAVRIGSLLESPDPLSIDEMRKIQNDVISPHALDVTRFLLAAFPDSAQQQPLVRQSLTYLSNWDGSMNKEEIAASVFNTWIVMMFEAMWKDRLGPDAFSEYMLLQGIPFRAFTVLLHSPQSEWFDDPATPRHENRDELIRRCLVAALQELTARFNSTEMKRWQWGEMHHMTFRHMLGAVKPLDKVLNIGPFPAGGALTTINSAQFDFDHRFESSIGPSMRIICDLSTKHVLSILTGGVSGQPFSAHYSDQTPLWRNGGYIDITMDPQEIPQAGWTRVVLEH